MDNMGDLSDLLAPILNDPETMEKLRQEAEKLGLSGALDGIGGIGGIGGASPTQGQDTAPGTPSGVSSGSRAGMTDNADEAGALLARLMPLLSGLSKEDDSTRLLRALRPFLSEKRGRRLDEAGKMLTIMRVIRMLPDPAPRGTKHT